jgi:prepilin-type N-terminal cleavage/methylation domain-containing protein
MKLRLASRRRNAFTLIEIIGVLAIIALLASLLVPRVFSAITDARISSTVLNCNGVKSAAMLYFGKYGKFGGTAGGTLLATNQAAWDMTVLIAEGFLEKPFEAKLGTAPQITLTTPVATTNAPAATDSAYDLDGNASNDVSLGNNVVEAVFTDVGLDDARELSLRIDGAALTEAVGATTEDIRGRVKYSTGGAVRIYIAHK